MKNLMILSVHASPLAAPGSDKSGGMNIYISEFAQELGRRNIAVDIYTRRTAANQPDIDTSLGVNVHVIHIPSGPDHTLPPQDIYPYLPQFVAEILKFVGQQHIAYDLIYSHYWLSGWVARRLKEIWHIPFVQMFHTLGHMKNRIAPGYTPTSSLDVRTGTELQLVRMADRLIAATPAEHTQLLWLYRARRSKIEIVPPGMNDRRFHPVPMEQAKIQLGLPIETNLLLFAGRIEPLKAVDTPLEALIHIQRARPDLLKNLKFYVIGGNLKGNSNEELQRLRSLRDQLNLQNVVEFLGAKAQTDLQAYYAASLAVVMPSDYESFGMVALEAMASGAPVIASQVGGLAFLVQDGKTGYLVPARDSSIMANRIISLLSDPEKRQQMGIAASQLAHQYTWPVIADHLLAIFEQLRQPANSLSLHRN